MPQQQALILSVNSIAAKAGAMQATRAIDDVGKAADRATSGIDRLEKAGRRMRSVGKAMTIGLTVPIAAVGVAATKMAADAVEAANKFDVVMGGSAARVREEFEKLHETIPLTTHEMEGLSAGVQDLLVPMGIARDRAAEMSTEFVKLAGDLGSFNNVSPQEAMRAITSGLAGEAEALRRYGVDVRQARLETLAYEEGLIGLNEELDAASRGQAVMLAITRDSKDAIGDAARTAGDAANQFKFLVRNLKELSVTIGNKLLPVITPMVQRMNEMLSAAEGLSSNTIQWGIAIGAVLAVSGPLLLFVGQLTTAAASLATALSVGLLPVLGVGGLLVLGLGAVATAFVKGRIEAANFRQEMDRLSEIGNQDPVRIGANLDETRAELEASQRRLAALKLDLQGKGGSTVSKDRLQDEFDAELATMVRLSAEVDRLESALGRVQSITPDSGSVLDPRTPEEMGKAVRALAAEIDYFVNRGAEIALVGDFTAPIARSVEFIGVGAQRMAQKFAEAKALAERFGMSLKEVIALVDDPAVRSGLTRMAEGANAQMDKLEGSVVNLSVAFSGSMVDALSDGEDAFKRFADYAVDQLLRIAAQMALFKGLELLFAGSTGGIGKVLGGLFAESFGGARAHGGPVSSGKSYLVGEQGPELFTPKQSGNITPNGGAAVSFDFSGFPAPTNPLAMARDAEWMRFLTESLENAKSGGYSFQGAG